MLSILKNKSNLMFRILKKKSQKIGLSPGTLIHVGEKMIERIKIRVMDYDEKGLEERELDTIDECFPYKKKSTITWINIDGLHELDTIQKIGDNFGIHELALEDIVDTDQRPKIEDLEDHIFIISNMLFFDNKSNQVRSEQFSLMLGPKYVISFQERPGDIFDPIRDRIRKGKTRIRRMGADYLAYTLIDAIVDNYFIVLEKMGEGLEALETDLIENPTPETLNKIHLMKRELILLRKSVWPLREMINGLERSESKLIQKKTSIFLRDLYDHTIQVIDTVETFRDMVSGMLDVYLSSVSNRMNDVMKFLTIIATLFIPLTFIAGIYGMNFKYMPELEWHWGYFVALGIMFAIIIIMLVWFRRKRFL